MFICMFHRHSSRGIESQWVTLSSFAEASVIYLFIYYKIVHEVHDRQTYSKNNKSSKSSTNHTHYIGLKHRKRCHKQTDHVRVVDTTCIPTTCCGEIFKVHNVGPKNCWRDLNHAPLREHSPITRLRPHMADPTCIQNLKSLLLAVSEILHAV